MYHHTKKKQKNGVTLTKDEEGNLIFNGTATTSVAFNASIGSTRTLTAGTYTKNITMDNNISSNMTVSIGYNNASISGTSIQPRVGIGTMTLAEDTSFDQVRIYIAAGTVFSNYKLNYMILAGEYTAQTIPAYEPYTGGQPSPNPDYPQDIHVVTGNNTVKIHGKNYLNTLAEKSAGYSTTIKGITFIMNNDGTITVNGTNTSGSTATFDFITNTPIPLNPRKVTSQLLSGNFNGTIKYICYDSRYGNTKTIEVPADRSVQQGTLSSNITYTKFRLNVYDGTTVNNARFGIMVIDSSANTDYEYFYKDYAVNLGDIELCKIGDYQDYLYKENGNWYKYNAIEKYVYNNDLAYNATSENFISVLTPALNIGILSQSQLIYISYCNMFTTYPINNTGFNGTTNNHKIRINISFSYATTLAEVKALCEEKSLSIYYGAETPTSTQITDETLISQLDEIYEHFKLVKGTNNITVTAEDLAPYMELTYMQDLPAKLDNLDSRLSLLE